MVYNTTFEYTTSIYIAVKPVTPYELVILRRISTDKKLDSTNNDPGFPLCAKDLHIDIQLEIRVCKFIVQSAATASSVCLNY